MNQIITKVDSDDKKMKMNKFELKKIVIAQSEEISSCIFLSNLITNIILDCYNVFLLVSQSPPLIASFSFYTLFPFHLYPPRVGQLVGVDTCPISIFLKSLCSSCKAENYYLGITFTLMRLKS